MRVHSASSFFPHLLFLYTLPVFTRSPIKLSFYFTFWLGCSWAKWERGRGGGVPMHGWRGWRQGISRGGKAIVLYSKVLEMHCWKKWWTEEEGREWERGWEKIKRCMLEASCCHCSDGWGFACYWIIGALQIGLHHSWETTYSLYSKIQQMWAHLQTIQWCTWAKNNFIAKPKLLATWNSFRHDSVCFE